MGTIECPVCTLYLRADMSLEAHLETHPKEQVIKALVSMATRPPSSPSVPPPATTPVANASPTMELAPMPIPSSRSRTPPNALMYHTTSGYEPVHQTAHPSLAPPQSGPMMTNSVPTSITVVKASDMGYPINNVMIVKSCSTKFVQQMPPGSGNPGGGGGGGGTATYASGPIDGRSIFIEPDRGGGGTAAITVRRQLAPSLYPRYTNERYSGPPPPYSTAISSTVTASSQLQQSSITGFTSKYEQKPVPQQQQQQQQQPYYPNPPPAPPVVQTTPTITISHQQQQQIYQAPPPPPPPPMMQQQQPQVMIQQQHQQFQASTSFKAHNFLQAQYTEKEDGHFIVTENPKKIVEYTENDEGDFMVIEKIIKSPPRIVQLTDDMEESPCPSRQGSPSLSNEHVDQEEEELEEYEMEIEDEEQYEEKVREDQSQISTIEIVENDDGTFDDNQGSYGIKDMPKPILIGNVGKKCNKFNLFVESSPLSAGHSSTSCFTPRKKPASGLKVLSNVKVTTDLSQGIKDIILNLNCKNKTSSVAGCSGSSTNVDGMKTSLISGVKSAAVVNNNCQNELIINAGSNMPPIDLNDVNDIEIINDDEEDIRSGEDEECYIGSMEVKATNAGNSHHTDKDSSETNSSASATSASRTTPTPSVITSVIRMTPHPSPVIAPSPPPPQPTQSTVVPAIATPPVQVTELVAQEKTAVVAVSDIPSSSNCSSSSSSAPKLAGLMAPRKLHAQSSVCGGMGSLFNKPPKKLTVKLKTPLPPVPSPTPPLVPSLTSENSIVTMFVPKVERFSCDDDVEQTQQAERQISTCTPTSLLMAGNANDGGAPSYIPPATLDESKYSADSSNQVQSQISTPSFVGKGLPTDVTLNASSTETITATVVTTKVERDAQLSETILLTQSSAHCSSSGSSSGSTSKSSFHDGLHIQDAAVPVSSQEIVQTTTTTTTEVECYNITFIDDEAAALNSHPMPESSAIAAHEVVEQSLDISNGSTVVKPEIEVDQKTNITEMCDLKIAEMHSLSPYNGSQVGDSENAASPPSGGFDQSESMLKNCIKVEKVEIIAKQELEELVSCATISEQKVEHKIAKIEPTATVTSLSAGSKIEFQKDQKDFLEAGPSRATTTADDGSGGSVSHSRMGNGGPTFLEYSAEYDDYVPVSGYGIPQEQIPLSWVQKFSPQYTPFDDQNSYMDLDICSSKNNSNSVGGNSATSGSASGGSGSRIDNSMDRAPSAESLNIRTDEKMPAKGEISEQESNGDMELSWNRLYPIHENIPIYPSSYDLSTAQECWNLSNRNSSGHNNSSNSSTSNNNNSLGGPACTSTVTMSHQYNLLPHHNNHHHQQQQHQTQHSNGNSFQFAQQDQQRNGGDGGDDQVDDKSKIHLDYGASSSSGANYLGLGPSGSSALQDEASRKLAKVRTYHCTECPKSFALLKQRRAHMSSEHDIDSKVNVLAPATATATSGVSSTVTSGSALGFFSSPGEGCSTTLLSKKIKIESQPMLMSYSSLKQELEQKQEGAIAAGDAAGPSGGTSAAGSAAASGEIRRKRTYVCGTCKQEFDRFKLFNAHLMTHPAECYTCGRSFKHWPNFALHIKRHLGIKDHQCRLCGKKFVIKQKLIEHMRVHTGKAPIKCPDCDQHFRRFSNLAQHRNRHHLNKVPSKKDFVCHCGEVYQSKAKMEWHKEIHENKPKSCPFCREKFIHKNSLTRHIRLSHTEKYVKLETATEMCTICNQPYIKTSMKRHMETHTEERMAYSCAICNKLFSTNWNLKQHKWTHANPTLKPFQCNMCSSGFVREADYITHMNAHKSIRPYTCNHCGCQFIRKYNWIRHTREHETDKNYTCEICGRKFHRKYYLTEHKRIHTGERPFSCNICGKTSSTKTNHNKHIKIHHARDPLTAEG